MGAVAQRLDQGQISFDRNSDSTLARAATEATRQAVAQQLACGIDVGNDGEQPRESFVTYLRYRMSGFSGESARPPVRDLLDKGVAVALGSDHAPGVTGITSMALVISLAVSYLGMSVDEALRAATIGGAHALRAPDRGAMVRGRLADMVLWDADHEGAFVWSYGLTPRRVWLGGEPIAAS